MTDREIVVANGSSSSLGSGPRRTRAGWLAGWLALAAGSGRHGLVLLSVMDGWVELHGSPSIVGSLGWPVRVTLARHRRVNFGSAAENHHHQHDPVQIVSRQDRSTLAPNCEARCNGPSPRQDHSKRRRPLKGGLCASAPVAAETRFTEHLLSGSAGIGARESSGRPPGRLHQPPGPPSAVPGMASGFPPEAASGPARGPRPREYKGGRGKEQQGSNG